MAIPGGHTHTLSHVRDFDADQHWDCGSAHITIKDGHLVTVRILGSEQAPTTKARSARREA